MSAPQAPRVALFVTCLVDLFRPSVGFAAVKLLEQAGCNVDVPLAQTCCGQPAFNMGDEDTAAMLAGQIQSTFEDYDYIVVPSGSCAGMIRKHFSDLLAISGQSCTVDAKCYELTQFLVDVMGVEEVRSDWEGSLTYHDSCTGLRELGIKAQPRALLSTVVGAELIEMEDAEICCGFGGSFSVKYPDVSKAIVGQKCQRVRASEATTLVAGDMGCLMNIAGKLQREGSDVEVRHVAEILAGGDGDQPLCAGIGAPDKEQKK